MKRIGMRMGARQIHATAGVGLAFALGAVAFFGSTRLSSACGGLFCNSPPPDPFAPLPVAQTGENVVFAIDKDPAGGAPTLTAHIQILYAGDAAKFSWVVPVDAVPMVGVGTDRLFSALASATQPQFNNQSETDGQCIPEPARNYPQPSVAGPGFGANMSGGAPTGATAPAVVTVSFQGVVGPYETAVISSTDPAELKKWLTDNGYTVSDQASGLIDSYVRDGKYFVALRLVNGTGIKAIQPVVLTFKGTEPCVPLRLTAIAANPDMQVRLWVLGDSRAIPKNFYELKIDDARIDWLSNGSNYNALVTEAAHKAGGNAFVAEYAGPSTIAAGQLWSPNQFDLTALQAAEIPPTYVQALISMGLANDAQTLVLLAKYIPMPDAVKSQGISDSQFYANLAVYWSQYKFPAYDLGMLTSEISTKIIEPRHVAQTMIDGHPYLTRLNTFISPEEMNKDPLFTLNPTLPDVSRVRTAVFRSMCGNLRFMACNAPVRLELPDGRMAWVRAGSTATTCGYGPYDVTGLNTLPAAETVWQREETGDGTVVTDNTTMIQARLSTYNSGFPAEQKMFPIPGATNVPAGPGLTSGQGGGCACGLARGTMASSSAMGGLLGLLGLTAFVGRRRRRRR